MSHRNLLLLCALLVVVSAPIWAADAGHGDDKKDNKDKGGLKLVDGMVSSVWAEEKQLVNPVAITIDEKGRVYVAETFRFRTGGGLDIREAMFMYLDDIKYSTPAERLAMYERYKAKYKPDYFTAKSERITVLEDTKGEGKADKATVYAGGFNHPLDGPAAGILAVDGKILFACSPTIWELSDSTGTGVSDKREVYFDGFGVRLSISGHDLHGLVMGPDGKIYWSMGDRGYNAKSREGKQYVAPMSGGVFRCNPDGSDMEIYYYGLRNPQELAFDEQGNLFTGDNNADIGDKARVVYILEGGSSGWTAGWQMLSYGKFAEAAGLGGRKPNPWLDEGMWKERFEEQPTWILPPCAHLTNGPCGMAHSPGTGLADKYKNYFFLCDYTAGTNSGIHAFKMDPEGAGFKMNDAHKFVWGLTATDLNFGYDGKTYISQYMGGWNITDKGKVVTVWDTEAIKQPAVAEVKKLVSEGFKQRGTDELSKLLKHVDMRVRMFAQFELAKRGNDGLKALSAAADAEGHTLSRLHGIWGLGQIARKDPEALKKIASLLGDKEAAVREQAAKTLGNHKYPEAADKLVALLKDTSLRARTFAAITLGKLQHKAALPALVEMLKENDDKDAFARHAAIMGLSGIAKADPDALKNLEKDGSRAVRLAVLLAYRTNSDAKTASFLSDADPLIYNEAIRAIYDLPIMGAMPQLQAELSKHVGAQNPAHSKMTDLLYHRLIHANFRYGKTENAPALAQFAAKSSASAAVRLQALLALEKWADITEVDPITGIYRPVNAPRRDKMAIREALQAPLDQIMSSADGELLAKATSLAASYGFKLDEKMLMDNLKNPKASEIVRLEGLRQFVAKKEPQLTTLVPTLLTDPSENMRVAALDALLQINPTAGIAAATEVLLGKKVTKVAGIQVLADKSEKDFKSLKMGPPSKDDIANGSGNAGPVFTYVKQFAAPNKLAGANGDELPRLNDGLQPENNDDTSKCVWLDGGDSRFVLDLKRSVEIACINVYSWHVSNRAPQVFTLWGANGDKMPAPESSKLEQNWTKIASVDTTSLKDGGIHGTSIFDAAGTIGKYRFLLWHNPKRSVGTFFGEIDVYEKGQQFTKVENTAEQAELRVKQEALLSLGRTNDPAAGAIISNYLDQMSAGKLNPSLQFDLLEAATLRTEEGIKAKVAQHEKTIDKDDELAPFKAALHGGDVGKGREVYQFHVAQCTRCHKIGDQAGGEAGPNLAGVGKRLPREKLLESLIMPNAVVVQGFGVVVFRMNDGTNVTGTIVKEDDKEVQVKQQDNSMVTLKVADIKKRIPPTSPMPAMGPVLKPREVRDVIEFMSTLQ